MSETTPKQLWNGEGLDPGLPKAWSALADAHDPVILQAIQDAGIEAKVERGADLGEIISAIVSTHPVIMTTLQSYLEAHPGTYDPDDLRRGCEADFGKPKFTF